MKSRNLMRTTCLLTAGFLGTGSLPAASADIAGRSQATCQGAGTDFQSEASQLLKQVHSKASRLAQDADVLSIYARGSISRESHSRQINLVKDDINAIGRHLAALAAMREDVATWQREAIDSVVPIAASLAVHTQGAIQHLNDAGKPIWAPGYADLLRAISDGSSQMKDTIGLHLEVAGTQEKLDQLRDRINTIGS